MARKRKVTKRWGKIGAPKSTTRKRWLAKIRPKSKSPLLYGRTKTGKLTKRTKFDPKTGLWLRIYRRPKKRELTRLEKFDPRIGRWLPVYK